MSENFYEDMMEARLEAEYFEPDYDPAYDDYEGECPMLPEVDGTYRLGNGWEDPGKTTGFWVGLTDGDYDYESDAEYGEYVGRWTDPEGKVAIDRVFWYENELTARSVGREYNQRAIWDIAAGKAIFL